MKKTLKQILLIFLATTLMGCSNKASSSMEEDFQSLVPVSDMNKSLEIKVDGDQKSFHISSLVHLGSDIPLLVQNTSPKFIFLNYKGGCINLFMFKDNEWIEVKNGLTYSGSTILSPQGKPLLNLDYSGAKPVFDNNIFKDNKTDILLRIVMTGEILENDKPTGKLVGAYVDVYIKP